jgi:hypothetical protein
MSLFRLLLYIAIGYIIYRIIQVTLRILSSGRERRREIDPFASHTPPDKPLKDFKDVKDADFEDIAPKDGTTPPPADGK